VTPAQQLLGSPVYLYQYKLNNKKAYGGDWWEWHQDFAFWHRDDGVPLPRMVSAMILFQDTRSVQGPLLFVPGSHREGIAAFEDKRHLHDKEPDLMNSLNADLKYTINKTLLRKLAQDAGIASGEGPVGTCIFFHPNLFHASNSNVSPFDRYTAILTYNDVANLPEDRVNNRPEYICSRNFDPIRIRTDALADVRVLDKQVLG
jgi:ectoine hydroxylase